MKKASKVLFIVGGIIAIILSVVYLIVSIVNFVRGGLILAFTEAFKAGNMSLSQMEAVNKALKALGFAQGIEAFDSVAALEAFGHKIVGRGIYFILMSVFAIPAAVLSFVSKGKENKNLALLIVTTVFNVFVWNVPSVVGGGLGIADFAVSRKKAQ